MGPKVASKSLAKSRKWKVIQMPVLKGCLLLSSSLLFPLLKYIFLQTYFVLVSCWRLYHQNLKKSGCSLSTRAVCQTLWQVLGSSVEWQQRVKVLTPPSSCCSPIPHPMPLQSCWQQNPKGVSLQIISIWNQSKCQAAWQQTIAL